MYEIVLFQLILIRYLCFQKRSIPTNTEIKQATEKDDDIIPISYKKPKTLIVEIGEDNLDVEIIKKIQNLYQPSIEGSDDEMISVLDKNS